MEIKHYAHIVWRWLWLIVGLPALVLAFSLLRPTPRPQGYVATMRFSVGLTPETPAAPSSYTYDRYYTWLTAEYLADDLSEVVKSGEIAQAVAAEAARQGLHVQLAPGAIQGSTAAGKLHRILTVTLSWPKADELAALASALSTVLSQGQAGYFDQFRAAGTPVVMHLIDPPSISPVGVSLKSRLELPLRLILGLLAGLGLAFFLEYLDDSVRGPQDLRMQGLDVLATIPRASALPWAERRQR